MLTNDAVPEPVGGSRDGNSLGANWKLENLSDDDPACGTPGAGTLLVKGRGNLVLKENFRCEEEDEYTHKDNQDVAGCLRVLRYGADDSDHELANRHADSSPNEQGATTELLNGVE